MPGEKSVKKAVLIPKRLTIIKHLHNFEERPSLQQPWIRDLFEKYKNAANSRFATIDELDEIVNSKSSSLKAHLFLETNAELFNHFNLYPTLISKDPKIKELLHRHQSIVEMLNSESPIEKLIDDKVIELEAELEYLTSKNNEIIHEEQAIQTLSQTLETNINNLIGKIQTLLPDGFRTLKAAKPESEKFKALLSCVEKLTDFLNKSEKYGLQRKKAMALKKELDEKIMVFNKFFFDPQEIQEGSLEQNANQLMQNTHTLVEQKRYSKGPLSMRFQTKIESINEMLEKQGAAFTQLDAEVQLRQLNTEINKLPEHLKQKVMPSFENAKAAYINHAEDIQEKLDAVREALVEPQNQTQKDNQAKKAEIKDILEKAKIKLMPIRTILGVLDTFTTFEQATKHELFQTELPSFYDMLEQIIKYIKNEKYGFPSSEVNTLVETLEFRFLQHQPGLSGLKNRALGKNHDIKLTQAFDSLVQAPEQVELTFEEKAKHRLEATPDFLSQIPHQIDIVKPMADYLSEKDTFSMLEANVSNKLAQVGDQLDQNKEKLKDGEQIESEFISLKKEYDTLTIGIKENIAQNPETLYKKQHSSIEKFKVIEEKVQNLQSKIEAGSMAFGKIKNECEQSIQSATNRFKVQSMHPEIWKPVNLEGSIQYLDSAQAKLKSTHTFKELIDAKAELYSLIEDIDSQNTKTIEKSSKAFTHHLESLKEAKKELDEKKPAYFEDEIQTLKGKITDELLQEMEQKLDKLNGAPEDRVNHLILIRAIEDLKAPSLEEIHSLQERIDSYEIQIKHLVNRLNLVLSDNRFTAMDSDPLRKTIEEKKEPYNTYEEMFNQHLETLLKNRLSEKRDEWVKREALITQGLDEFKSYKSLEEYRNIKTKLDNSVRKREEWSVPALHGYEDFKEKLRILDKTIDEKDVAYTKIENDLTQFKLMIEARKHEIVNEDIYKEIQSIISEMETEITTRFGESYLQKTPNEVGENALDREQIELERLHPDLPFVLNAYQDLKAATQSCVLEKTLGEAKEFLKKEVISVMVSAKKQIHDPSLIERFKALIERLRSYLTSKKEERPASVGFFGVGRKKKVEEVIEKLRDPGPKNG